MLTKFIAKLSSEEGHALPLLGVVIASVGAVLLAVGAVNDQDVLTIIGAVVLAVGLLATSLLQHMGVEYGIFGRLDEIEKG